jgi:hypothetical protein
MATYDIGDVVTLTCTVRDAGGALADAGAITCTITLPDGTTAGPTPAHPSTGTYTATYTPAAAGRFAVKWVATGTNAGAFADDFTVIGSVPLLTRSHLETHLQRTISAADQASADAACDYAVAMVNQRLGFDPCTATFTDDTTTPATTVRVGADDVTAARAVAVRIAAQWFTNPQDRSSYAGPEGLSYVASPQLLSKLMSDADRVVLETIQLRYNPGF